MAGKARFVKALAASKLLRRNTPLLIYWFVTNRCNYRCSYCYGSFHQDPRPDLPTATMLRIGDEMARAGVRRVNLLGGEPLLRPDIGVLIDHLARRKISVCLLTNGSLLPGQIEGIRQVDEVGLSIDGAEAIHDAIRGAGAFRALTDSIATLRAWRIPVVLTYTMVAGNIDQLDFVMQYARREGVSVTVNVAHGRIFGTKDSPVSRASDDACRASLRSLIDYRKRGYPVFRARRTLELMLRWRSYQEDTCEVPPAPGFPRCSFGTRAAAITSAGELVPCFLTDRGGGLSLQEHSFATAWRNCQGIAHCAYCHVPCFIEYNAIFELSLPVLFNAGMNLCVRPLFPSRRAPKDRRGQSGPSDRTPGSPAS